MSHCQISSVLILVLIFIFDSLLLFSPLIELYGLVQHYNLRLESTNPLSGVSLHVVDHVVHDCLDGVRRGKVRTEDGLVDWVGAAVGVCTDNVRFDWLILSVDQDLLPRAEHSVIGIVTSVDHNTVFVELLNLLDGRQPSGILPVELAHQTLADGQERHIECVSHLQGCWNVLHIFRVEMTLIILTNLHFLSLCFYYK